MGRLFTEKAVSVNNERRYSRRRKQQGEDVLWQDAAIAANLREVGYGG